MNFYRKNAVIYNIKPEDNSTQRVVHMGENVLNLSFVRTTPFDFRVGDYTMFDSTRYTLKQPVNATKLSRHHFEYSAQFCAPQYDLQDALYVLTDTTGVGELNDTIPLFGTLSFHLQQIVKCIQEVHPGWTIGTVEDTGEGKNVTYSDMDCMEALQHLAEEFNTEYWFQSPTSPTSPNLINMGTFKQGTPLLFKYGKGNSTYDLSRTNQDGRIVTKLLVTGSNRNINPLTYGSALLRLPGGGKYVTRNTDKYGIVMGRQKFPDIYPRLIHKVESDPGRITAARQDNNGIFYVKDSHLNFNPGELMLPGLSIKVHFQTGQLGGMSIETTWHNDTQEFELIRADYGLGIDVPASAFYPAAGDLYLLEDIKMPQSYITAAEAELLAAATEAIAQISEQKVSYKGTLNELYFRTLAKITPPEGAGGLHVGGAVNVQDSDLTGSNQTIPLRIQALTRNINNQYNCQVEISDTLYIGRIQRMETAIQEVKEAVIINKPKNGSTGPAIVYRGIYADIAANERIFYNNFKRRDIVKYNNIYYIYRAADGATNAEWNALNWDKFGDQFDAVATKLLLAENANLAGFIFKDNKLISQTGTLNGTPSTNFGSPNFIPNIVLDGITGSGQLAGKNFIWDANGNVAITGKFESSSNGDRIVIDPATAGNKMRLINENNDEVIGLGFYDDSDDYTDDAYYFGIIKLTKYHNRQELSRVSIQPTHISFVNMNGGVSEFGYGRLFLQGLPTSPTHLASGTVYRNGNYLCIV